MILRLQWRPFRFTLPTPLRTARGCVGEKRGWLLRLESDDGRVGWGEAAPLPEEGRDPLAATATVVEERLPERLGRDELEALLPDLHGSLAFALGAALAELDGLVGPAAGGWLPPPPSAWLLPAGEMALGALESAVGQQQRLPACGRSGDAPIPRLPFTVKWKVAADDDALERRLLEEILCRLPAAARLRLDANGGWDRPTAGAWAERLAGEGRLAWLEQPLAPSDHRGLELLAARLPVALDESLRQDPLLTERWSGWQVRRPAVDGDPRPLLWQLQAGVPHRVLSTAFETGIGRRWLHHLAALQARGPTPAAPGLAPGWRPRGELFAADPQRVWRAA